MALFDDTAPAGSEAVKLGAKRIRDLKTSLNTLLGTLFNDDGSPKDNTVTTDEIADAAVTAVKLATDAVETAKIKDAAVTAVKLATDAVETVKIKDAAVTAVKLATDSIITVKIQDAAVTSAKIAAGAITADKIDSGLIVPYALARWTGAGYYKKDLTQNVVGNQIVITTVAGVIPIAGSGVTVDNAPCGIVAHNVTADDSTTDCGGSVTLGHLYYVFAVDATHITLHTSAQGAIDGTTGLVTLAGNFANSSANYFKFLDPSTVTKRGCDVVPLVSSQNADRLLGWRIVWRTAPSNAGVVHVRNTQLVANNSSEVELSAHDTADARTFYMDQDLNALTTHLTTAQVFADARVLSLLALK